MPGGGDDLDDEQRMRRRRLRQDVGDVACVGALAARDLRRDVDDAGGDIAASGRRADGKVADGGGGHLPGRPGGDIDGGGRAEERRGAAAMFAEILAVDSSEPPLQLRV